MSRFVSQDPLSRGPGGTFGGGSGIRTPGLLPVNDNKFGQIAQVLTQAVGAYAGVKQVNQREQDESLAQDWETSKAQLIRLRGEATRDPSKESAFLSTYDSLSEKFAGTRYEAELATAGEGFKNQAESRAVQRSSLLVQGFFQNKVLPAVREDILAKQDELSANPDYTDRLASVREIVSSYITPDMPQFLGPDGDLHMQRLIDSAALSLNEGLQSRYEKNMETQQRLAETESWQGSLVGFANGSIDYSDLLTASKVLNIPSAQAERDASSYMLDAVATAVRTGDMETLVAGAQTAYTALEQATDPRARASLAEAVGAAEEARGALVSANMGLLWSDSLAKGGVSYANQQIEDAARTLLFDYYGEDALTVADVSLLPQDGFKGSYLRSITQALKAYTQDPTAADEAPAPVQEALRMALRPMDAGVTAADATSWLNLTPENWGMATALLANRPEELGQLVQEPTIIAGRVIQSDDDYLQLWAEAQNNPVLRSALIANRVQNSRNEADFFKTIATESFMGSDDGVQMIFAAADTLGGLSAISKHVSDPATKFALNAAFVANTPTAAAVSSYKQIYEQTKFKVGNAKDLSLAQAMVTQDFAKAFLDLGGWGGRKNIGFGLPSEIVDKMLAMYPMELIPGDGRADEKVLASRFKDVMARSNTHLVWSDAVTPGGRPTFSLVQSGAIPEAVGFPTSAVEEGLNAPGSPIDRYMGRRLGDETTTLWTHAVNAAINSGINVLGADAETIRTELFRQRDLGNARIRVATNQATESGVPLYLVLSEQGQQSRTILLGEYNFNDNFLDRVGPGFIQAPAKADGSLRSKVREATSDIRPGAGMSDIFGAAMDGAIFNPF